MCRKTNMTKEDVEFLKALFMIDMNNGFVNFGPMANPKYNDLVPEQQALIEKYIEHAFKYTYSNGITEGMNNLIKQYTDKAGAQIR